MSDKWVLTELTTMVAATLTANLDKYELGLAAEQGARTLFGTCYCDWYIEIVQDPPERRRRPRPPTPPARCWCMCWTGALKLLHPVHAVHHRGDLSGPAQAAARAS